MRKILMLFVASLAVATNVQNPFEPLASVLQSREIPKMARLNQGVDEFVQIIVYLIQNNGFMISYYPMNVPDVHLSFTANLPHKPYHGVWHLENGKLYGIDHYYRYGDAGLSYDRHFYYVKVPIQFRDLSFVYNSLVKMKDVEQEETVIASIEKLVFSYVIKIDRHNLNAHAENLVIESVSPVDVKVMENNRMDQQINKDFTFDETTFRDLIVDLLLTNAIKELAPFAAEFNSRHA